MWWLAQAFEEQLLDILEFLQRYQWWAIGLSVLAVVLVNVRNFRRGAGRSVAPTRPTVPRSGPWQRSRSAATPSTPSASSPRSARPPRRSRSPAATCADVTAGDFAGKSLVLNIFPSIDTGVCAASVRAFNEKAGGRDDATVLNVSADLPFAQTRFCGAEGIENVTSASTFRSDFGIDYGVTISRRPAGRAAVAGRRRRSTPTAW